MTVVLVMVLVSSLIYSFTSNKFMGESKTKALDVFLYLGIGISLIVSVTNIIQILFTAINRKFPDVLNSVMSYDTSSSDVRLSIATLVVIFPLYIFLSWYVAQDISKFLYKRDLTIRKVMIYFTIFVTLCTLIGTLVSVIYAYLGGELSVRFGYKALVVFAVASAVFGYYFYSIKRDYVTKSNVPLFAGLVASIIVIGSLVWSVSIIGTPAQMRAKKIDSTRLSDISRIQQEVYNQFTTTDKLPVSLDKLNNAFQGYSVPTDPVTKESYSYRVIQQPVVKMNFSQNKKELTTEGIFELCATFTTERTVDARGMQMTGGALYSANNYYYEGDVSSPFWNHKAELTCFKRVISSDIYYGK